MPITISLMMTNVITGEVMFAHSVSTDVRGLMQPEAFEARATAEFDQQFDAALVTLVDESHDRFRPGAVTARVRGRLGERFVVDAGLVEGLREGDQMGEDARVVFADTHYAIVEPTLDALRVGQSLTRYVAQPVEALNRPSLLVVAASASPDLPAEYVTVLMEEAITAAGGFSLVTINPAAAAIRGPQLTATGVERRDPALPDYFLRTTVAPLDPVEAATNVQGVVRRVQQARAYVEVIDRDGRVVFAREGRDDQVEEISGGIAPPTAQRRDAAVRNALVRAAETLRAEFSPVGQRLDVRSASQDELLIDDAGGALAIGSDVSVLRSAGRVPGIDAEVWSPVTDVEVVSFAKGVTTARQAGVEAVRVRRGDVIAHTSVGTPLRSRLNYAQCTDQSGNLVIDVRGEPQHLFGPIALNAFASDFPGAVRVATLPSEARRLGLEAVSSGYANLRALQPITPDLCFEPVLNLAMAGERPSGRSFTQTSHNLTVGFVVKRAGARVAGSGLQQTLNATAVPVDAEPSMRSASLQIDLADAVPTLARRAASQMSLPQ